MKNFLHIRDIPLKDLKKIISDAKNRKSKRKKLNTLDPDKDSPLKGKILLQMFEKSSLRTRLSFYLAIKQLGGGSLTLRPEELHLGIGSESIADTSKILSTYGNAFMLRTDSDKKLDQFKKYSSIPIINGLSPSSHPTQVLSDIFTIQEIKKKSISKLKLCWIGDANNNMMNSLIEASIKFSVSLNIASFLANFIVFVSTLKFLNDLSFFFLFTLSFIEMILSVITTSEFLTAISFLLKIFIFPLCFFIIEISILFG